VIRVGVAGWDYEDWKGPVYPAPAPRGFDPLAWLSGWFDLIEVNSTFYRPPAEKMVRSWLSRVEGRPDFRFTAKVWRRFTHERSTFTAADVRAAREGLDILAGAGRLGAALLQFPWSFKRNEDSREWLRAGHLSFFFPSFRGASAGRVPFVKESPPSFPSSTRMWSPGTKSPERSFVASGSWIMRWMARLSGRAP